jgi:NAD(P)-dependent dehydrogenase (short-subunit alcohol dehydrogenase family)
MNGVKDKIAFITGGSSGIGLGVARAFVDAGMKVIIGYRTKEHLETAMQFFETRADRIHAIKVDVTDRASMAAAADESERVFGKVHVLVNNAGVVSFERFSATTYEDWDWTIGVNVNGVFNGIRTFLPRMLAHGEGGHIIATSSLAGLAGINTLGAYTASKFAVVGMMESLRTELSESRIGVSVYCPSFVRTNILDARRNHPSGSGGRPENQDQATLNAVRDLLNNPAIANDPLAAGQLVLEGMRRNALYILDGYIEAYPAVGQLLRDRTELLIQSVARDARAPRSRTLQSTEEHPPSMYSSELDRLRCAQSLGKPSQEGRRR